LKPSNPAWWKGKDVTTIGPLECKYTFWKENDSWYFHIRKKVLGRESSWHRLAHTEVEAAEEANEFLDPIITQINETKKGKLIPIFEDNMIAAMMTKRDVGFWDESPYCFRSIGLIIRVTFYKRTNSYQFHFLRPNRYEKRYDKNEDWIGSCLTITTPQVKDLVAYTKKKMQKKK